MTSLSVASNPPPPSPVAAAPTSPVAAAPTSPTAAAPTSPVAVAPTSPVAADPPLPVSVPAVPPAVPVAPGFQIVGSINLFGIKGLTAEHYDWQGGDYPGSVTVDPSNAPIYQQAKLPDVFHLSTVVAKLEGTPFDHIQFNNAVFTYQNYAFDSTLGVGLNISGDVVFDQACGPIYDVIHLALRIPAPTIHLTAQLGESAGIFSQPPKPTGLTVNGSFPGVQLHICDDLTITSIALQLQGSPFSFSVYGTMDVKVPGLVIPLVLDYSIAEQAGTINLTANPTQSVWSNAFGHQNLNLTAVSLTSTLDAKAPLTTFNFNTTASLPFGTSSAVFTGTYAAGQSYSLSAVVSNFTMTNLAALIQTLGGEQIHLPAEDLSIDTASLTLASGTGLDIELQNIQFEGHMAANASLTISSTGATLHGDLTSANGQGIPFGEVDLVKAFITVNFTKGKTGSTSVLLGGQVLIEKLIVDVDVQLYKDASGSQWTIYADLTPPGQSWTLSKLGHDIPGFLDFEIMDVCFCACSKANPDMSAFLMDSTSTTRTFNQGVQVCATVGAIDLISKLERSKAAASGFLLGAGWSKAGGFQLDITPQPQSQLDLGKAKTKPFMLMVEAGGLNPSLILTAGLEIPMHSGYPLEFDFDLAIGADVASATCIMRDWVEPFGLKNVTIDEVLLGVGITLVPFDLSSFTLGATLAIGKATANLDIQISDVPTDEFVSAGVQNLDIDDMVSFVNTLFNAHIPLPPDFITINKADLYICPAGATIAGISYQPGITFDMDATLFGRSLDLTCYTSSSGLSMTGNMSALSLGPLAVSSMDDSSKGPSMSLAISASEQYLNIDGKVRWFAEEIGIKGNIEIRPNPAFSVEMVVGFTDILTFDLTLALDGYQGDLKSIKDLSQADFSFDAKLQFGNFPEIVNYVSEEVDKIIKDAEDIAKDGIGKVTSLVKSSHEAEHNVATLQNHVVVAQAAWVNKQQSVVHPSLAVIAQFNATSASLQQQVTAARANYSQTRSQLEAGLLSAQRDRTTKLTAAQSTLRSVQLKLSTEVQTANKRLSEAQVQMTRQYGNVPLAIAQATQNVTAATQAMAAAQHMAAIERSPFAKLAAVRNRQAAAVRLATASATLKTAQNVLHNPGYLAAQAAVNAAGTAVASAQSSGQVELSAAETALAAVDRATSAAVSAAQASVNNVEKSPAAVALSSATQALSAFQATNAPAVQAATTALATVSTAPEAANLQLVQQQLAAAKHDQVGINARVAAANEHPLVVASRMQGQAPVAVAATPAPPPTPPKDLIISISLVELSGSLKGIVGKDGTASKPLTAHVVGEIAGKSFNWTGTWTSGHTDDFIKELAKQLLNDFKAEIEKAFKDLAGDAKKVADKVGEGVEHGATVVDDGAKHEASVVGNGVEHGATVVGKGAEHGVSVVGKGAEHSVSVVGGGVKDVGHKAESGVKDVGNKIKHFF